MHELSISRAILATVERHAAGSAVAAIELRVGALRQVIPESLGFYFEVVSRGGCCAGAEIRIEAIPALLRCAACGREWDPHPSASHQGIPTLPSFRCPSCRSADAEVLHGDELEVVSIEVLAGVAPDPVAASGGPGKEV